MLEGALRDDDEPDRLVRLVLHCQPGAAAAQLPFALTGRRLAIDHLVQFALFVDNAVAGDARAVDEFAAQEPPVAIDPQLLRPLNPSGRLDRVST